MNLKGEAKTSGCVPDKLPRSRPGNGMDENELGSRGDREKDGGTDNSLRERKS